MTPIAEFPLARCVVGVERATWCVRKADVTFPLGGDKGILPFVSCLEEELSTLRLMLREGLARQGLDPALEQTFPVEEIIEAAFLGFSEHWVDRALDWIAQAGVPPKAVPRLRTFIENGRGTQRQRHRVRRLLLAHA